MWKIYIRTGLLAGAFLAGMMLPGAAPFSKLVPYLIMLMLGVTFLTRKLDLRHIRKLHWLLLVCSLLLALMTWGILKFCGASPELAAAGFYIAFTPTAAAAPVIIAMLDGDVEFTAFATILSNLAAAILFPAALTALNGEFHPEIFWHAAARVAQMVLLPAVAGAMLRKWVPGSVEFGRKMGKYTFYCWTASLFLLSAKAGLFLREHPQSMWFILSAAVLAGVLCALQFFLGGVFGEKFGMRREGSQCLGQKNTSLTIYLAMTYTSPAAALGPGFYIFFHNLWNACQLQNHAKQLVQKQSGQNGHYGHHGL